MRLLKQLELLVFLCVARDKPAVLFAYCFHWWLSFTALSPLNTSARYECGARVHNGYAE